MIEPVDTLVWTGVLAVMMLVTLGLLILTASIVHAIRLQSINRRAMLRGVEIAENNGTAEISDPSKDKDKEETEVKSD
jgi:hypothetical protein